MQIPYPTWIEPPNDTVEKRFSYHPEPEDPNWRDKVVKAIGIRSKFVHRHVLGNESSHLRTCRHEDLEHADPTMQRKVLKTLQSGFRVPLARFSLYWGWWVCGYRAATHVVTY